MSFQMLHTTGKQLQLIWKNFKMFLYVCIFLSMCKVEILASLCAVRSKNVEYGQLPDIERGHEGLYFFKNGFALYYTKFLVLLLQEKLFSSKNRTEASLGKKLKNDMLPEIEKEHKVLKAAFFPGYIRAVMGYICVFQLAEKMIASSFHWHFVMFLSCVVSVLWLQ